MSYVLLLLLVGSGSDYWQTTSGAEGNVVIWDVSEEEPKQVETIRGIIPAVHDVE
jgi:hypothetical protein